MEYNEWLISIYDETIKRYKKEHEFKLKKFKELSVKVKIQLILFIVCCLIGFLLNIYGIYKKYNEFLFMGCLVMFMPPTLLLYSQKYDLQYFKDNIEILKQVLESENLNNVEAIERLIKDTSGVLYRINDMLIPKLIINVIGASGITYIINKLGGEVISLVISLFILIITVCLLGYYILRSIPNSKIIKKNT